MNLILIVQIIEKIISNLDNIVENYGTIGLLIIMIVQSLIPIALPSDAVILAAVILEMDSFIIITISALGSTIGGIFAFLITRKGGKPVAIKFIGENKINKLENWFEKWGYYVVVFGRAAPFLSSDAVSYAAGLTKMNITIFIILAFIGALIRSIIIVYLGDISLNLIPKFFT
jgi:uncharacterized membrane protein YdjX (TVP38/TMEM64 family)